VAPKVSGYIAEVLRQRQREGRGRQLLRGSTTGLPDSAGPGQGDVAALRRRRTHLDAQIEKAQDEN